MAWVIAVDPGRNSGVAKFEDGKLSKVALVHNEDLAVSLDDMVSEAEEGTEVLIIVEVPQVYNVTKSKGNPNDLIKLAMTAGCPITIADLWDAEVLEVKPYEWKGQLPKEVVQQRVERILTIEEKAVLERDLRSCESPVPKHLWHNVYDAIGIGLGQVDRGIK